MTRERMSALYMGRKHRYSAIGIARRKCASCGKPARYQWNCCANGNRWVPVCGKCDVEMNEMFLRFVRHPFRGALMARYRKQVLG